MKPGFLWIFVSTTILNHIPFFYVFLWPLVLKILKFFFLLSFHCPAICHHTGKTTGLWLVANCLCSLTNVDVLGMSVSRPNRKKCSSHATVFPLVGTLIQIISSTQLPILSVFQGFFFSLKIIIFCQIWLKLFCWLTCY